MVDHEVKSNSQRLSQEWQITCFPGQGVLSNQGGEGHRNDIGARQVLYPNKGGMVVLFHPTVGAKQMMLSHISAVI